MRLIQAERRIARFCGGILLGETSDCADPQGANELETWKPSKIVRMPFPEL
jgi:hypothetical protein